MVSPWPLLAKWLASSGRSPASYNPRSLERVAEEDGGKDRPTSMMRRAGGRAAVGESLHSYEPIPGPMLAHPVPGA
jgi:fructose 1,6-bisphosphatase